MADTYPKIAQLKDVEALRARLQELALDLPVDDRILTAEGRRLADERHAFMEAFFQRFLEEYDGKR